VTYELDPHRPRFTESRWECGCVLSDVNDDETCEEHRHTPVIREGASLRTGDELLEVFVIDAADLLGDGDLPAAWAVVLEACDEDHAVHGAWLGNDDLREELEEIKRHAEGQLVNAGWTVDWDDGYVIWRPTTDAPAEEVRRQEELRDG